MFDNERTSSCLENRCFKRKKGWAKAKPHTYSKATDVPDLMVISEMCTNWALRLHTCNRRKLLKLSTGCKSYYLDMAGIKKSPSTRIRIMQHMLLGTLPYTVDVDNQELFYFPFMYSTVQFGFLAPVF